MKNAECREEIEMSNHILENEKLRVTISDRGAELVSAVDKSIDIERLWQADPTVWNRHAPILFPFVGKVVNGKYRVNGQEYDMKTQHGFARDMDFVCLDETENHIIHQLTATEETLRIYPFDFSLTVCHELDPQEPSRLNIRWTVENRGEERMLYAIGGHPAFLPPDGITKEQGRVVFPGKEELSCFSANAEGYALPGNRHTLHLDKGYASWQNDIPETWIFENEGVGCVGLSGADRKPFVLVHCEEFPILAVWANPKGPFICLESWFGRTDEAGFDGTLENKPGMQVLDGHEKNEIAWAIDFCI